MISDEYREQNKILHETSADYGSGSGEKFSWFIKSVMKNTGSSTVLDYGCGKGTLKDSLGECVTNYDPAIEKWSSIPSPADLVVCTDVLEHVEPEFLDEVIEHIRKLTIKVAFFVISCRPARRTLPDGRNAHLIVKPQDWWTEKLRQHFVIFSTFNGEDNLMVLCK